MKKQLIILFLLLGFVNTVSGQEEREYSYDYITDLYGDELEELYPEPCPPPVIEYVHDTVYISTLDSVTRLFGMTFDEYVRTFMTVKDRKDTLRNLSTEKIYLNYFLPLLDTKYPIFNSRIVSREYVVMPGVNIVNLKQVTHPEAHVLENSGMKTDCLITVYGTDETDIFLGSPSLIKSCLGQVFQTVYEAKGKIKGLTFYFPDYSFGKKRAMAQFLKSANLVIDSCKLEPIHNLKLYALFDRNLAKENEAFLDGIAQMTDSIFVFQEENPQGILQKMTAIDHSAAKSLHLLSKLENQFYLARYYTKPFPERSSTEFRIQDIYNMMEADYPDNHWEMFLYAIIVIILLLLVVLAFYLTTPTVSYYVDRNIDYVYSFLLIIALEILILVANMFEAMSNDHVFSLNDDNRYFVLLFPLLFIFVVPMMKVIGKRRNLP